MKIILEVGSNLVERVSSIIAYKVDSINDINKNEILIKKGIVTKDLSLIFVEVDDLETRIPSEVFKYVYRIFKVPNACHDLDYLRTHKSLKKLLSNPNTCFKIKCHPKSMGEYIVNSLSCNESAEDEPCSNSCKCFAKCYCTFRVSDTKTTHTLHIVLADDATFYWGIVVNSTINKDATEILNNNNNDGNHGMDSNNYNNGVFIDVEDALNLNATVTTNHDNSKSNSNSDGNTSKIHENVLLTTEGMLRRMLETRKADNLTPPVCRAFFKLQEVMEMHLPLMGWKYNTKLNSNNSNNNNNNNNNNMMATAVDMGASPGGWTQYLHDYCGMRVLAVDPGLLHESVVSLPHVIHVPHLIESGHFRDLIENLRQQQQQQPQEGVEEMRIMLMVCDVNLNARKAGRIIKDTLLTYMLPRNTNNGNNNNNNNNNSSRESYICLTLKMLKKPKPWHITSAVNDALEELKSGVAQVLSISLEKVSSFEWNREKHEHQDMIMSKGTAMVFYSCVHLCANSLNERTLLIKIVC